MVRVRPMGHIAPSGTTILRGNMDLKQQRVLQSHRRVQAWCAANPGHIPPPVGPSDAWSPVTRQLDMLNTVVPQVMDSAAEQDVQVRMLTLEATDESSLRGAVRADMRTISRFAQALRSTVPGIGVLTMPSPATQVEGLLKAADAFSKLASTYEPVLAEHGLAPDALARLRTAIATLRKSVDGRGSARAALVSATTQVATGLSTATRLVQLVDAALMQTLKTDPAKVAEWKNAKRVTTKGVLPSGIALLAAHGSTLARATPTLVTQTAASTPHTSPPAVAPVATPDPDAKVA